MARFVYCGDLVSHTKDDGQRKALELIGGTQRHLYLGHRHERSRLSSGRFLRTSQHSKTIPLHVMAASEHTAQAERKIDAESSRQEVPLRSEKDLGKCFIGSIDQGTTSTRFMIFNGHGVPVASHQVEFKQIYPQSGCVKGRARKTLP